MINVRSGGSGYILDLIANSSSFESLLSKTVRTPRGLEFKKLVELPSLVIKGQQYGEITAKKTMTLEDENKLKWLLEHGFYYSPLIDKIRRIEGAPQINLTAYRVGFTCKGLPEIGAKSNGKTIKGFYGILTKEFNFSGNVEFIRN